MELDLQQPRELATDTEAFLVLRRRRLWIVAVQVLAAAVPLTLLVFWETAAAAFDAWTTSTFGHAVFVPLICGYLIWRRRATLARLSPKPDYWGLLLLAAGVLAWLVGQLLGLLVVQQFALVAILQALVFAILGRVVTRAIAFPLLYLYFAVPFGDFLVPSLQQVTGEFVVRGLQLSGVPVYLDGVFISIPGGNFEVAKACAGYRYLIAMVALGVLAAQEFYRDWWRRAILIVFSVIIPIVANGIRAYGIVLVAYLSDFTIAIAVDHIFYGWFFFALVTLLFLGVGALFYDRHVKMAAAPSVAERTLPLARPASFALSGFLAMVAVGAGVVVDAKVVDDGGATVVAPRLVAPIARLPWRPVTANLLDWRPSFPQADAEVMQRYASGSRTVDYYVAFYSRQRQGIELVSSRNTLANKEVWTRAGSGAVRAIIDGESRRVEYIRLLSRSRGRVVWYWYWADGRFTAEPLLAKILQAKSRLFGSGAAALIAVATDYESTPSEAAEILHEFLQNIGPLGPSFDRVANGPKTAARSDGGSVGSILDGG